HITEHITVYMPTLGRLAGYPVAIPTPTLHREVARSDVVFVQDAAPIGSAAVLLASRKGVPVCMFCHHDERVMLSRVLGAAPLVDSYMGWLYGRCQRVLFATARFRAKLERVGVPEERMVYAPFAVDTSRFSPHVGRGWRREWGIPQDAPVALYLGRLSPEKNISTLMRAAHIILERRQDAYFVLAGTGPLLERCRRMGRRMASSDRLIITGFVPDAARVYAACDVFVLPSLNESQCFATMEAMASGLACVVPFEPPSPYSYLEDEETCVMVRDVMDAEEVAEKVLELFEHRERARAIGRRARERMLSLSWDEHVCTLEKTFDAISRAAPRSNP
ncbi:glycosyltransferase, partial [Methermicoccus shengliensis]|nr:glycosyltransferase family 1 protein [Methermicoccus shengliensis]